MRGGGGACPGDQQRPVPAEPQVEQQLEEQLELPGVLHQGLRDVCVRLLAARPQVGVGVDPHHVLHQPAGQVAFGDVLLRGGVVRGAGSRTAGNEGPCSKTVYGTSGPAGAMLIRDSFRGQNESVTDAKP